jgi:ribosome-binding factor A
VSERIPKINQLLKRELGQLILKEIDFPKGILVTVTRVETMANLIEAKVYVSVMPETQTAKILRILDRMVYYLQQKINKRLKMRPVPKIRFLEEKETSEAARIEEILEDLKEGKK